MNICKPLNLPITPRTKLEKAVQGAKDAWFRSEVDVYQLRNAQKNLEAAETEIKLFIQQRDANRRDCAEKIKIAHDLYKQENPKGNWLEWAPQAFGWSRATIARRMQDLADPAAANGRREYDTERKSSKSRKVSVSDTSPAPSTSAAAPVSVSSPASEASNVMPLRPAVKAKSRPQISFKRCVEEWRHFDVSEIEEIKNLVFSYFGASHAKAK